jgi:hypothetical protein
MLVVAGAYRCDELVHLKIYDIEDVKSALTNLVPVTVQKNRLLQK